MAFTAPSGKCLPIISAILSADKGALVDGLKTTVFFAAIAITTRCSSSRFMNC
jgi:hypothetical protein